MVFAHHQRESWWLAVCIHLLQLRWDSFIFLKLVLPEALSLMLISNELPGCSKLLSHACLKNSMLMGAVGEVEEAEGRY